MTNVKNFRKFTGVRRTKYYKDTLFQGDFMMVGINCLEPGQTQDIHDHAEQDKAYIVMEGSGHFTVGAETREAAAGEIIWARAGTPHGVENHSDSRLVVLVCMSPPPPEKYEPGKAG